MLKKLFTILFCLFVTHSTWAGFSSQQETRRYIVLLRGPSLSSNVVDEQGLSLYRGLAARPTQQRKQIQKKRMQFVDRIRHFENRLKVISPDIAPRRRFTGLINGLSLDMPADLSSRIRSLPEVLAVVPNRQYRAYLTKSNDLMNVPYAWQLVGGKAQAGAGIKIGIIDTGIDHTHVMFDDAGYTFPEGFPLGDTAFTNRKIIVARVFTKDGDTAANTTPRDRHGHGTHVASCAAGRLNTPSPLGPISGVAPNAYLGNYKVFTSETTTLEQIIAALEACVEDGMDVVNLSLGSVAYVHDFLDPEAIAIKNTIKAGVVVVAAAGNEGETETIGSPAQFPDVITVGSISNSHIVTKPSDTPVVLMDVYKDGAPFITAEEVVLGPDPNFFSTPVLGRFQLTDADAKDGGAFGGEQDGLGCDGFPPGAFNGKWALIQRGICTFTNKIDHAQAAGAWGALIYNQRNAEEALDEPLRTPSVSGTEIPAYFLSHQSGRRIKEAMQTASVVDVEFYTLPPIERTQNALNLSDTSSLGPSLSHTIKPEIVAIGDGSYAATQNDLPGELGVLFFVPTGFDASGFHFSYGTSFAAPRVTGAAALIKQVFPGWTPGQIKSALLLSADRPTSLLSLSSMERGAGHIQPGWAMDVPILASPATLSWGRRLIHTSTESEKTVKLTNVSDRDQSLSVTYATPGRQRLSPALISPEQIRLAASESVDIRVQLTLDPPTREGDIKDIEGDLNIAIENHPEALQIPLWARTMKAPVPNSNSVLLVDDDSGETLESRYIEAIRASGMEVTRWDVDKLKTYPNYRYMQQVRAVIWFLASTSLNSLDEEEFLPSYNNRIRFNVELTRYLARGGRLLISGMDWSDQHEFTSFGQQVLHIQEFNRDPFVTFSTRGRVLSHQSRLTVSGIDDNPVGRGISPVTTTFNQDNLNLTDTLTVDQSGLAKPALVAERDPDQVIGITVEAGTYRAVFLAFALERLATTERHAIIGNSLSWLMNDPPRTFSIRTIDPPVQLDNSVPITVTLTVDGINFLVGHEAFLNNMPVDITEMDWDGTVKIVIPAELPAGLYNVTLRSPDDQSTTHEQSFEVRNPG